MPNAPISLSLSLSLSPTKTKITKWKKKSPERKMYRNPRVAVVVDAVVVVVVVVVFFISSRRPPNLIYIQIFFFLLFLSCAPASYFSFVCLNLRLPVHPHCSKVGRVTIYHGSLPFGVFFPYRNTSVGSVFSLLDEKKKQTFLAVETNGELALKCWFQFPPKTFCSK